MTERLKETLTKENERFNPQEPLFLLIDYFRVRFPTTEALTIIRDILHIRGKGCRQMEGYLLAQERNWYDFMLEKAKQTIA